MERVVKVIDDLAKVPAVSSGTVGFYLAPLAAADKPLASRNSRQSFITASTMKTLTTGAALELLGPDFRFETRLLFSPSTGDILIKGAGDPSLGRPDWEALFEEWTAALLQGGIREISGRVTADETAWEPQEIPDGWTWLDMGNYYAPPLTPLCYQDNTLRVYFQLDGKPGAPAGFYDADPWPAGLEFTDELRIGKPGTGDNAYLYGGPGTASYALRGTLAADNGRDFIKGALPDPALFCAQHFTDWLNRHEIPVHGPATTSRRLEKAAKTAALSANPAGNPKKPAAALLPQDARLIGNHLSAPLREMLIPINHRSLNLDCECLLKTLGDGSLRAGLRRIREHLASKGLPLAGYEQCDGSGLSRTNMVTPELLARANASFLTGPHGADYLASLPEVGQGGSTLRSLEVPETPAVIHAKSGTIERVKAYTGIVDAGSGRQFIFAILVNNYDGSYSRSVSPGLDDLFEALGQL
ncbi:MAG: D-alanyl-D-alanine carboxypeptidase [Verrucomicrobiota bacterium]